MKNSSIWSHGFQKIMAFKLSMLPDLLMKFCLNTSSIRIWLPLFDSSTCMDSVDPRNLIKMCILILGLLKEIWIVWDKFRGGLGTGNKLRVLLVLLNSKNRSNYLLKIMKSTIFVWNFCKKTKSWKEKIINYRKSLTC